MALGDSTEDDLQEHLATTARARSLRAGMAAERRGFRAAMTDKFEAVQAKLARRAGETPDQLREKWFAFFDAWDPEYVYECLAENLHIPAIADFHGAPTTVLMDWCKERLDPARTRAARKAAAARSATEAVHVLADATELTRSSPAALAKVVGDRAKTLMLHAERLDNDLWGPPLPSLPEQGRVQIVLALDGQSAPKEFIDHQADKRAAKLAAAPTRFDPATALQATTPADDEDIVVAPNAPATTRRGG